MKADAGRSSLRGLDVLETFGRAGKQLSLSVLARLSGIPVSTCHGVVRALERRGFLYFASPREAYPTRKLLELAAGIDARDPVLAQLAPALAALREETGETALLGVRQGDAVLYLLVLESPQAIRYTAHSGDRKPLHSSAIGKVLLGAMGEAERQDWLGTHRLSRVTPSTITSARRLRADLAASLRRGYYLTRGENVADVMALAAPVRRAGAVFGVAVAGPLHRMEAAEVRIAARLRHCLRAFD
ncbi:MAG: IclR family transcriptional regulator [Burkholderiales bacterium]|nr:IclR family transcriptional regulator [Burkholderiales bacterium]